MTRICFSFLRVKTSYAPRTSLHIYVACFGSHVFATRYLIFSIGIRILSQYLRPTYILTYYVYYCFMHEPASPQRVVQRITSITKQGEGRTQLSFALFSLLPFGKCICNPPAKLMKSYVRFNFRRYLMLIICNIAKNHTSITKHDE